MELQNQLKSLCYDKLPRPGVWSESQLLMKPVIYRLKTAMTEAETSC
jgi:hypothetical protein